MHLNQMLNKASVILCLMVCQMFAASAQEASESAPQGQVASEQVLPQQCIELPHHSNICDHRLYKRASISVPSIGVKQGSMICVCMADFQSLRIPIKNGIAATEQQVEIKRSANKLDISEFQLLTLIRD